jgi:type I restriction enzyme S subunit
LIASAMVDYPTPPESWKIVPAWTLFRRVKTIGLPDEELLSVYRDHGVIPKSSRDDNHNVESEDLSSYQLVQPGDLVMNKMKAWQGSIAISEYRGIVSPAYFVFKVSKNVYPKYIHYLMRSAPLIAAYNRISKGVRVGQWDLEPQEFRKLPVLVPPLDEQRRIAAHLAREIQQIDDLAQQLGVLRKSVQERFAREVRSLVFGESLTNRLNVGPKFGPVQDIPATWDFDKASRLFRASKGTRGAELTVEYCAQNEGDFPVFSGQTERDGVMGFIDSYEFDSGKEELLFTTTVGAKAMTVRRVGGRFSLSQNCMVIRNQKPDRIDIGFAFHYLSTLFAHKRKELSEHMQASFRMSDLYEMWLMFPELEEQKTISRAADAEAKRVAELFSVIDGVKKLLLERKQALVTEYVLGLEGTTSDGNSY